MPNITCPCGYVMGDDYDRHDECDTCPFHTYQACGGQVKINSEKDVK